MSETARRYGTSTQFWTLQTLGWTAYAVDRYLADRAFFPVSFIYLCVAFLLTVVFLRPIYRAVYRRAPTAAAALGTAVLCSCIAAVLWLVVARVVFAVLGLMRPPDGTLREYVGETIRATLVHHKPFLFLSWSGIYFGMKFWTDAQVRRERAIEATAVAAEAELRALRAQLNPHFLFNALNATGALIQEDAARAQRVVAQLAVFLRHSLAGAGAHDVSVQEEIAAASAYLDVEQMRYEDKLEVRMRLSAGAMERRVPPLILQPLVENAVKYGMLTSPRPLSIEVAAETTSEGLVGRAVRSEETQRLIVSRVVAHASGSAAAGQIEALR